jgi:hypothetical protein
MHCHLQLCQEKLYRKNSNTKHAAVSGNQIRIFLMLLSVFHCIINFPGISNAGSHCFMPDSNYSSLSSVKLPDSFFIDQDDSVKFNIPDGLINGNIIDVPVSISSDDTIYSVDFAIRYKFQNIEFDSIINLTPGLQYLYHLSPVDSVFRFTSNRLTPVPNDSTLLMIRFRTFTGQICAFDLDSLISYLNGEPCEAIASGCLITSQHEIENPELSDLLFPNPATSRIQFRADIRQGLLLVMNTQGVSVLKKFLSGPETIDLGALPKGLYFIRHDNEPVQKLILQ